jgi:peptidyl-prolyl cis-trans isomerase SurA
MTMRKSVVTALVAGSILMAGCKKQPGTDVAATVNGKAIYTADVEKYYKNSAGENKQQPSAEQQQIQKLNILHQLVDEEILEQQAQKLKLVASDEEVDSKLAEMKAPFTEEEFQARMKANGLTLADVRKQLRRTLTIDKLFNKEINTRINITDADIANYYEQNKAQYNLVEPAYHIAQIVVTSVPSQQPVNVQNSKATNDAEAKKKIQMLHSRLVGGEDFGNLAMNFSEQPNTSSNGGDMGFISDSQLKSDPEVYTDITKLQPGQFTDVLPIYDNQGGQRRVVGYVIYKLITKEPAGQRMLNDPRVQQDIRTRLRDARSQLLKNAYYEILRDKAQIENYMARQIFKTQGQ